MPRFGKSRKEVLNDLIPIIIGKPYETDKKGLLEHEPSRQALGATSSSLRNSVFGNEKERNAKITKQLLLAVAYGMESKTANTPIELGKIVTTLKDKCGAPIIDKTTGKPKETKLFNPNLYANDLLKKSPEFLLERGDVTDWAGRTFKNITAFEYALWARDFKMIEMMLSCIPATAKGDKIQAALFEQAKQVTAPITARGGLTYIHTYKFPKLDKGIPIKDADENWVYESLKVERDENHFDLTPLIEAYEDYERNFDRRTLLEQKACWIKVIGSYQRLFPVHILQRYCDWGTPFYPLPQFNGEFKRSVEFDNNVTKSDSSLFNSALSFKFALVGERASGWGRGGGVGQIECRTGCFGDLAALRKLDKVSTNEIEKIIRQLSQSRQVPPYTKVKQLVDRFANGSLRAKNAVVTDPSNQEHVRHLETSLQAINQLIDRIDRLEESADKTPFLLELMPILGQLRYHSLMRSDALNRGITAETKKVAPICSEDEFNELHRALKPQLPNTLSESSNLLNTSSEIKEEIAAQLDINSHKELTRTKNSVFFNDTRIARLGPHLLRHVVKGNQDTVIEMLTKHPELINYRGDIEDKNSQKHKKINVFGLALTNASPEQMTPIIYKCLFNHKKTTELIREELFAQLGRGFLEHVAKGEQKAAEAIIQEYPEFLLFEGEFTDFSGRTFTCTAYEYAYWAKDTHMQRMLEKYMDADIGREMLRLIDEIERIDTATGEKVGLTYEQNGQKCHSAHFDSQKLFQALQAYVDGYADWYNARDRAAIDDAWLQVGLAQRNVVVHIANEYCRTDRSFDPNPPFNESTLPRILSFYNWNTGRYGSWFPLAASESGLGFDFGLVRGRAQGAVEAEAGKKRRGASMDSARSDLAAVIRLDEVRTAELTQSRENLNSLARSQELSR